MKEGSHMKSRKPKASGIRRKPRKPPPVKHVTEGVLKPNRAMEKGITVRGKLPRTGGETEHALIDDIGNPSVRGQEDYGGAGDLGTTGAVGQPLSRSGKVGVHDPEPRRPRRAPGNTGER